MRRATAIVVAALIGGIVARAWLIELAPRYGFFGDHVDYVCWAREALDVGVLALYTQPPGACPADAYFTGERRTIVSGAGERLNYPPLAAYVFWGYGQALAALDPARTANTVTARALFAVTTTTAELVAAIGIGAIVRGFAGPLLAALAFAATWLAPPLLVDGPFWGQTESWILAPSVWMVWAMTRERWALAGALWGIALALKPSGMLLAPLWAYALAFRAPRGRIVAGGVIALLILNAIALPFWLTSGVAWLRTAYLANYKFNLHWTTMLGFNVWYADLLLNGKLDSKTTLLGVTRDTWGTMLLIAGLLAAFALTRRWERWHPECRRLAFVPLAALVTVAAVTLPTRVHCTYNAFPAPFLIATACLMPRSAPAAIVLVLAGTLQILSWQWGNLLAVHLLPNELSFPAARQAERRAMRARDAPREWALTIVSVGAALAVYVAVATTRRRDGDDPPARASGVAGT